jgi:hypothetical protein
MQNCARYMILRLKTNLELHEVRAVLVAESEARLKVLDHDRVGDLDGSIDGLLGLLLDLGAVFSNKIYDMKFEKRV